MYIKNLELENFRNYDYLNLELSQGLTIVTGENAQGKTNLLEAIFLLSLAKSHRTNRDQEMIFWEKDYAKIKAEVSTDNFNFPLELILNKRGKIAKYNHLEQSKLSQFIGKLNVILFAPEDMQLVKGSPSIRRRFIDSELGQAHPLYLQSLVDYNRILKQRNAYLKQIRENQSFDPVYFDILTDQLINQAVKIVNYRLEFIDKLSKIAQPLLHDLSNQRDKLTISYKSSSSRLDYQENTLLKEQFINLFEASQEREKLQGVTLYGPHRDDILFYINDNLAQHFASQGQQRTVVLSLKLAELELIYQLTGEYPILLLDDVLSELDDQRQHLLMSRIEGKVQTVLTTASIENLKVHQMPQAEILYVKNGQVNKGEVKND